jgi:hypothetical protein
MNTTQTYIATPSPDEIEAAWFELMQGELGIDRDRHIQNLAQTMIDVARSQVLFVDDGPVGAVSSVDMARRVATAIAALIYD